MRAKRSWWQKIRKPLGVIGIIAACVLIIALIVAIIGGYRNNWEWTGVGKGESKTTKTWITPGTTTATPVITVATETQPEKTLWDWLGLLSVLAIPAAVGFGTIWFTKKQGEVSDAENTDNQREAALQAYIDKISELLLKEHLGEEHLRERSADGQLKPGYEQVQKIARVRTITILFQLDTRRTDYVLAFLRESGLIDIDNAKCTIPLSEANLSKVNLSGVNLNSINLSRADLSGANLSEADLSRADLYRADLSGVNLSRADLRKTHLSRANLREANLSEAYFSQPLFIDAESNEFIRIMNEATEKDRLNNGERVELFRSHPLAKEFIRSPDRLEDFIEWYLSRDSLRGANLSEANLSRADLRRTHFRYAKLNKADLSGADLSKADLSGANLSEANLSTAYSNSSEDKVVAKANLRKADLSGADLKDAIGITTKQLEKQTNLLKGATMPDGTKHL